MTLRYIDRKEVLAMTARGAGFGLTKIMAILDEFSKSEADFAEVCFEQGEYSSIQSAYVAIHSSIKRFGYSFRVRTIRGGVYLDKK